MDLFPIRRQSVEDENTSGMLGAIGTHPAARTSTRARTATIRPNQPAKKMKLTVSLPPVQDGIISASKTPVIEDGRLVNVRINVSHEITDDSMLDFFDANDAEVITEIPEYQIDSTVMDVLKDSKASEEELRDAIFTNFSKSQKIEFAESSDSKKYDQRGSRKYAEEQLNKILSDFGQEINVEQGNMEKYMRGLPVTTTSRPDLVPRDDRDPTYPQLTMGEFKNRDNYKEENGRTQCLMYLLALLYWLRAVAGKPVESVYGFYFCGCRCSDQNNGKTYSVGLLKLSSPQYLGDELSAYCLRSTQLVEDPLPLRVLIHFLKKGKRWTTNEAVTARIGRNLPCLFVLPTSLWSDDGEKRNLVPHGTLSIVFRITAQGLKDLLQAEKYFNLKRSRRRAWKEYCEKLCMHVDKDNSGAGYYYLKVRTKNSAWQSRPMGAMDDVWDLLVDDFHDTYIDDFQDTYIDRPFVDEAFGMVLMNDRGLLLRHVEFFEKSILSEFAKVRATAMFLSKHLPHGDVLPHNLVFDKQSGKMTLIDVDEGVSKAEKGTDHILKRKNAYFDENQDWFIALSYPNPLRHKGAALYTQTQLLSCFLFLAKRIENLSEQFLKDLETVRKKAEAVGKELVKLDRDDALVSTFNGASIPKELGEIEEAVINLIDSVT